MSQTARIRRISFRGVPAYLGEHQGNPIYSGNPQRVSEWLCDGFRTRFNQHRSTRSRYATVDGERVLDANGDFMLRPIGSSVTDITDSQARQQFPHLAGLPAMVLQAPTKIEPSEWFAAIKRRKVLGGDLPGFRSRKLGDKRFSCWFNGGANATFHRTGKRSGMVVIRGKNPPAANRKGRWELRFHIYVSQDIRPYTSIQVDVAKNRIAFVSPAVPVNRDSASGVTGIDRGVVNTAVTSDAEFFSVPDTEMLDRKIKSYQKKMSRSRLRAEADGRNWKTASRYTSYRQQCAKLQAQRAACKNDAIHNYTTRLAEKYDTVVLEALKVQAMTAKGKKLSKKKLNRRIRDARWSTLMSQLRYKTGSTEERPKVFVVNPAYTSQRCFTCGHIASENRESQAEFRCVACGHTDNADINAAKNIVAKHQQEWTTPALSKGKTGNPSGNQAPALTRKPPALTGS